MKNIRKISNYSIAGLLAVGVLSLGIFAYRAKVQADTILPGYATAHVGLDITVPQTGTLPFTAKFLPIDGGKKYYFKSRDFTFEVAGLNTIEWYIRKIPEGNYKVVVTSLDAELAGSPIEIFLQNDQVNDTYDFGLNLGSPAPAETPVPSPTPTIMPDELIPPEENPFDSLPEQTVAPVESPASNSQNGLPPIPGVF